MKLRALRLHQIGPFQDAAIDIDAIDGTVIAITGRNGAGKTSLLELGFAGPLYRATPNQGTLAARATSRDAFVESAIGDYVIRQCVDSQTGAGEAMVRHADGRVLVESGKVRAFDAWAAAHLPPSDLFFASVFGAQGAAGFLGMTAADRKRVLLRALGIEAIETLAERARVQLSEEQAHARSLAALVAEERGRSMSVDAALAALEQAEIGLTAAREEERAAQAALDAVRAASAAREVVAAETRAHAEKLAALQFQRAGLVEAWTKLDDRATSLAAKVEGRQALVATAEQTDARRAHLADLEAAVRAADEHEAREREALDELADVQERIAEHRARLAKAMVTAAEAAALRAHAAKVEPLRTQVAAADRDMRVLEQEAQEAVAAAEREQGRAVDALARRSQEERRMAAAVERITAAAGAIEAEEALPRLREEEATTRAVQLAAEHEVERLRGLMLGGKDQRIAGLRGGLTGIVNAAPSRSALDLGSDADWTLRQDDTAVAEQAAAPDALDRAKDALDAADHLAVKAERALREAELLAARRPELEAARADLDAATEAQAIAETERAEHKRLAAEYRAVAAEKAAAVRELAPDLRGLREVLAAAEKAAARLPEIAAAEATIAAIETQVEDAGRRLAEVQDRIARLGAHPERPLDRQVVAAADLLAESEAARRELPAVLQAEAALVELETQLDAKSAEIRTIDEQLVALGRGPSVPPLVDAVAAEDRIGRAVDAARAAERAHARAEAALATARATAEKVAGLEVSLRTAEDAVADWTLLARALGRDGIQALLIDAAGPELTGLVNDLLRACFGSRYTVTIATTRAKKSGEGEREVCDVLVYDAETGREGEAATLSGGQRVIVGEAIALALSALSCRRAGLRDVTLVRDETGAALDSDNARAYVAMLRRAAQIVGASKVLFVSHNPETWSLADARIVVGAGGKVSIEGHAAGPALELEERAAA